MSLINVLCIAWPFFFSPSFPVWESIFCLVERLKTTQFNFSTPINPCATSLLYPSWKNEYKRFEKRRRRKRIERKQMKRIFWSCIFFPRYYALVHAWHCCITQSTRLQLPPSSAALCNSVSPEDNCKCRSRARQQTTPILFVAKSPYETLKQRAAISNCLPLIVLEKAWLVHLTCFFAKSANQQLVIRNSLLLLLRLVPLKSGSCLKLTRSNLEQGFRSRTHFNQVIVRRMQVELRAKRFRSASTRPPIANVQIAIRGEGKEKEKKKYAFSLPPFSRAAVSLMKLSPFEI